MAARVGRCTDGIHVDRLASRRVVALALVPMILTTSGCSGMRLDDVASDTPRFDFFAYFEGHTRASGWFADRFGRPRRHFCGDFVGTREEEPMLLDEALHYTDGVRERRLWRVTIDDAGAFRAESESLIGVARGIVRGNGLEIRYAMPIATTDGGEMTFDFADFMLLQPDGSLHNITHVKKWGVRLGTVSTQYDRHDGSETCATRAPPLARRAERREPATV